MPAIVPTTAPAGNPWCLSLALPDAELGRVVPKLAVEGGTVLVVVVELRGVGFETVVVVGTGFLVGARVVPNATTRSADVASSNPSPTLGVGK
jgi:hypothetical protein